MNYMFLGNDRTQRDRVRETQPLFNDDYPYYPLMYDNYWRPDVGSFNPHLSITAVALKMFIAHIKTFSKRSIV